LMTKTWEQQEPYSISFFRPTSFYPVSPKQNTINSAQQPKPV